MSKDAWKSLSLREKIGQTICIQAKPEEGQADEAQIAEYLEKNPVGSVFIGGEIIKAAEQGPEQVAEKARWYSGGSKIPLLFASDMEAGAGHMVKALTQYPQQLALAATASPELAYEYGKGTALESRSVGVNWSFSPVADLNLNPRNALTNIRSLGDDAEKVIPLMEQLIAGMQENGLSATAKHFPGDGVDWRNQHFVTTCNSLSKEEWLANHGKVFQAAINAGVHSIMPGHICLPWYQETDKVDGRYLPATLSPELILGLLKKEMGFKGVVVSDALIMGGFLKWPKPFEELEIDCFKAGIDMMLWPSTGYIDRMERAINDGYVSEERLDDAVSRIWDVKTKSGLMEDSYATVMDLTDKEQAFAQTVGEQVAIKSLTLVRDRKEILPLPTDRKLKILVFNLLPHKDNNESADHLAAALKEYDVDADIRYGMWITELEKIEGAYDFILYAVYHQHLGSTELTGSLWTPLCYGMDKSIVVSFGNPYVIEESFEAAPCAVNTYSDAKVTIEKTVAALFGKVSFAGISPVQLEQPGHQITTGRK